MNRTAGLMALCLVVGAAVMYGGSNFRLRVETVAAPDAKAPEPLPTAHTGEPRRLPGSHLHRQRHLEVEYRSRYGSSWNQKKPTAPGPACVPTTAPSVSTSSISACGLALPT